MVCEYLVRQQLKSMLPQMFRKSDPNKPPFVVMDDNEAVIKSLAKGRSPKLRHVARTHRVNLDWCYDLFRHPEVIARYVSTMYQIADLGTKAIVKGDTWLRLTQLMGIKPPGMAKKEEKFEITKNKANQAINTEANSSKATNNSKYDHLLRVTNALLLMHSPSTFFFQI